MLWNRKQKLDTGLRGILSLSWKLDDFCQLRELEKQIVIHKALNTKTTICKKCKEKEEEWEKQRHLVESELHRLSTRIPAESKGFRHWDKDKYGNSMFPSTKEKV